MGKKFPEHGSRGEMVVKTHYPWREVFTEEWSRTFLGEWGRREMLRQEGIKEDAALVAHGGGSTRGERTSGIEPAAWILSRPSPAGGGAKRMNGAASRPDSVRTVTGPNKMTQPQSSWGGEREEVFREEAAEVAGGGGPGRAEIGKENGEEPAAGILSSPSPAQSRGPSLGGVSQVERGSLVGARERKEMPREEVAVVAGGGGSGGAENKVEGEESGIEPRRTRPSRAHRDRFGRIIDSTWRYIPSPRPAPAHLHLEEGAGEENNEREMETAPTTQEQRIGAGGHAKKDEHISPLI